MRALVLASLLTLLTGCGEEEIVMGDTSAPEADKAKDAVAQAAEAPRDVPPPVDFQETAFTESEHSRDPFRNYAKIFVDEVRGQVRSQREVVLEQYAIEELRLVALIQRIEPARAMLVDPSGVGHVVQRGQFIGRASLVEPTGGAGAAYEVNWRVDRIRDGDLVLVRDDPSNPDVPSATRVIPLRTENVTTGSSESAEAGEAGLEAELRKMQERLATMAATEAARKRTEGEGKP
jgi:type IV pilus assembly protein PilP